jgi:transposase
LENATTTMPDLTIGIDLGDRHSHLCLLDDTGTVVEEARLATTPEAFRHRFTGLRRARMAIEVGTHSPWVSALLQELGHEVLVANPRKLRMIYSSDSKNDRCDAQQLARVARMDPRLLSPIEHRGRQTAIDLAVLRSRDSMVRARTRLVNHVRGTLKGFGLRAKQCSTTSFDKQVPEQIPAELQPALAPVVTAIGELTTAIAGYDKLLAKLCRESYAETDLLRQVPGVGPVTALSFILTLEDPGRFKKSRSVGAYLGMRPKQQQSGKSDPELRITKAGDHDLRRLLVQCAQYTLGPFGKDTDLRRWGLALAARGGKAAKKRAIVAVARKLAVLLHRLWASGEVYDPLRQANKADRRPAISA